MQQELLNEEPGLQIQFIGVNELGHESANSVAASVGKDLPLLQDVDEDGDGRSDVWTSWDVRYRDVIVVDASGEVVDTYNLTINNLESSTKFAELKDIVLEAAPEPTGDPIPGDCNTDGVLNAADLSCVGNIEERDLVLDELDTLPGDLDGDGEVAFADFLVLSNNFGKDVDGYSEGDIDLSGSVGFADFLTLSNNFGKKAEADSSASSVDAAFAVFGDADDED